MTATMPPPASTPSLHNPLTVGRVLFRVVGCRGRFQIQEAKVSEVQHHYAKVGGEWIDARVLHGEWLRDRRSAVIRLGGVPMEDFRKSQYYIAREILLANEPRRLRPHQWAAEIGHAVHPKTIAVAMRWLASHGLAERTGKRRGRWKTL